jgi:predicted pyridoxine 5'-phosphate oxidase superfamily flavin-nucleotide-binding protein
MQKSRPDIFYNNPFKKLRRQQMAKMTERMMELFTKVPTAILATATNDGTPNAVPVGAKKIIDNETILISDQFFNKTLANMKTNPKIAVTFWEGHEGYQLKGTVTIETSGKRYEETAAWIEDKGNKAGFPLKSKGAMILKIEEIFGLSPGPGAGKKLV